MALYAISDLHLSFGADKPMDVFGSAWADYDKRLYKNFQNLKEDDLTVIPGDISWSMDLKDALSDFRFIESLPGKKIISKGNHDYWWDTVSKIKRFFDENSISGISIMHNNAYKYNDIALCGTRGWFYEENSADRKIYMRELGRLKASLDAALALCSDRIFCFLHYPPICSGFECEEITDMLSEYGVEKCFYGHLHSYGHKSAYCGEHKNVKYELISADYLGFEPILIG